MEKYVIVKGWEGFCDRLQMLSYGINIALRFNRTLYVDWRDRIWTHDDSDFYRYFKLVGIPHLTSTDIIPKDASVYPVFWKRGFDMPADEWMYEVRSWVEFDPLEASRTLGTHFEDVWVVPGLGSRSYDFTELAKHLRLTEETVQQVAPFLPETPTTLPVVHLRGTDRAVPEGAWDRLRQAAPVALVLSDDKALADRWMAESPESLLSSGSRVAGSVAGHKLSAAELQKHGLTKHEMNIQLIADFLLLASAAEAYALNEESLFFKMARLFSGVGGAAKIVRAAA